MKFLQNLKYPDLKRKISMFTTDIIKKIFELKNTCCCGVKCKSITIMGKKIVIKKQPPLEEILKDIKTSYLFTKLKVRHNSILLIEPNAFHGEILPGYIKYFQDLGFNVDVLLRHKNITDNPLVAFDNVNKFGCTINLFKKLLKSSVINNYEYCFLTSSALWDTKLYYGSFLDFLGFEPDTKHGILMVEHNVERYIKEYREEKYLNANRLFTLSGFHNTPMLNPHYFIDIPKNYKKNNKTKFIIAGHCVKGREILIDAIDKLLACNTTEFEIIVIGAKLKTLNKYSKYIKSVGFLNFSEMYKCVVNADFILPMLDYTDENHKKYVADATSGSRQLSLGFLKPVLINDVFAKAYGYNDLNSFVYSDNNLFESMKKAIEMNEKQYSDMQQELKKLAAEIYSVSLNNLKNALYK